MMRVSKFRLLPVLAVLLLLALPSAALAANAYGQTFAGQAKCLSCHGKTGGRWQVAYTDTAHGSFVTDVQAATSTLVPAPTSALWPSGTMALSLSFGPSDVWLMVGAPGKPHEYVSRYLNDTSHVLSTGSTLSNIAGPADDTLIFDPITFDTPSNMWELSGAVSSRAYFQGCGGCHFLGVTRPSDTTYTLGSGATMSHSTETSYSGFGIQCENCHGTGKATEGEDEHQDAGVSIVRTKQALESQTCGQCHVNGTAKEKNYVGKTFSQPNGYTADKNLEDFYNVAGVQYEQTSSAVPAPSIPTTDTKFYPNGANKGMHHSYYNEYILTSHARSLHYKDGELWSSDAKDSCLKCHSGEGFLKSIGYGTSGYYQTNDIGALPSSVESDTLDVECGVCHTVHSPTGDALGLRLPREELCGRCHNTELAEGTTAEPGQAVDHSQREMFEGYGLIGVPKAEPMMGNATCPDCHMPITRETRMSHSFKVMLPGDAETWGVQAFGDSCTRCHTTYTRSALQSRIDTWRASTAGGVAEATAAIAAAESRAASATAAGKRLLAAAETNVAFVQQDGSGGVHNYSYEKAGLDKATLFANAVGAGFESFGVTSRDTRTGMSMVFGKLAMGDGSVRAGETIVIEAQVGGTTAWEKAGEAVTVASGEFACAVGPTATTRYRARWTALDDGTALYSSADTVSVGSKTTLSVSAKKLRSGSTLKLSGTVAPNHEGARVRIDYRYGSTWRRLTYRTLGSSSAFSYSWRPTTRGTLRLRAVFVGDVTHTASTSPAVSVSIY